MIIVTNPGSNLPRDVVERYDIVLTPQQIVVDGKQHDTRHLESLVDVDEWVETAKVHPYVLGTSAAEFVTLFRELAEKDRELLVVMTSRKIIGSHDAAVSAARTIAGMPAYADMKITVIDTQATDVGAGLVTVFCAKARERGLDRRAIADAAATFAGHGRMAMIPKTLDNLVKGGRASFLKAWAANLLNVAPLISFVDGELKSVEKVSRSADQPAAIADFLAGKIGKGRRVWAGATHGGDASAATRVGMALRERFDVAHLTVQPFTPSIYLHVGPGALGAFVFPIDQLPFVP